MLLPRLSVFLLLCAALLPPAGGQVETGVLAPDAAASNDYFGSSIAIAPSGAIVAIGAYNDSGVGAVYVYLSAPTAWAVLSKLTYSAAQLADAFGTSVAISSNGSVILVGTPQTLSSVNTSTGLGVVFVRTGNATWVQSATLFASDARPGVGDGVGCVVALSGDGTIAVMGALIRNEIYVFSYSAGTWSQAARIGGGEPIGTTYGRTLALSSDGLSLVVGAPLRGYGGIVYAYSGTLGTPSSWLLHSAIYQIQVTDISYGDGFGGGICMSADGSLVLIASLNRYGGGKVYGFGRGVDGQFLLLPNSLTGLQASDGVSGDGFGTACAISPNGWAIVGAPNKMNGNAMTTGGAYILDMSGDEFFQITDIVPSDAANAPGSFGASVGISLDGSFLVVGDPSKTGPAPNFYTEQGKAYQFYNGSLPTPTQTMSQTQTSSQTMTASSSNSASVSATPTATPSHTPTPPTPTPPATLSSSSTASNTHTPTPPTPTPPSTVSSSSTASNTHTPTPPSITATPTGTPSTSRTGTSSSSRTGTGSASKTGTPSHSRTGTNSASHTGTASSSHTGTPSSSKTETPSASHTGTASSSHTGTPSASHTGTKSASRTGTPSSSRTGTGSASHTGSPSASRTGTSSPSHTETPSSSHTGSPSASRTGTSSSSHTETPSRSRTGTPSTSYSSTPSSSRTATVSLSSTGTPSSSHTDTPSASRTDTSSSSHTGTPSSSKTGTPSPSKTDTPSSSRTGTPSSSKSGTPSPSKTDTPSSSRTGTPSPSTSATPSASGSGTSSSSHTGSSSSSHSGTSSSSRTRTPSASHTGSPSASRTGTPSASATGTSSASLSDTPSPSTSGTPSSSVSGTPSHSATGTGSASRSGTPSASRTETPSASHSDTPSSSHSGTPSGSISGTPPLTASPSHSTSHSGTRTLTSSGTSTMSGTMTSSGTMTMSGTTTMTMSGTMSGTSTASPSAVPLSPSRSTTSSPSPTPSPAALLLRAWASNASLVIDVSNDPSTELRPPPSQSPFGDAGAAIVMSDSLPNVTYVVTVPGLTAGLSDYHSSSGGGGPTQLLFEGAEVSCVSITISEAGGGGDSGPLIIISPSVPLRVFSDTDTAILTLSPVFQRNNSAPRWERVLVDCTASLVEAGADGVSVQFLEFARNALAVAFMRTTWPFFSAVLRDDVVVDLGTGSGGGGNGTNGSSGVNVTGGGRRLALHRSMRVAHGSGAGSSSARSSAGIDASLTAIFAAPPPSTRRQRWRAMQAADGGGSGFSLPPPVPLEVLLPGSANITIVGDTTSTWMTSGPFFSVNTTVYIGSALCPVLAVASDGSTITVTTPPYAVLCGNNSNCPNLPLIVSNPDGGIASCPPFCPGYVHLNAPLPVALPISLNSSSSSSSGGSSGVGSVVIVPNSLIYALTASGESSLLIDQQLSSGSGGANGSSASITASNGGGIKYISACAGFTDPTSGACTNSSDPRSQSCAFGSGTSCTACPLGAICPGGNRAWPLPGYWTPAEESGLIVACPYPAVDRCTRFDQVSKAVVCGSSYAAGSVACGACKTGWYATLDGVCDRCPGPGDTWANVAPGLLFFLALILTTLMLVSIVILILYWSNDAKRRRGDAGARSDRTMRLHMQLLATRVLSLLVWLFTVLQVQTQVANAAGPGLPLFLRQLYNRLNLFSFYGLGTPPACLGPDGPLVSLAGEFATVSALYVILLVLLVVDFRAHGIDGSGGERRAAIAAAERNRRVVISGSDKRVLNSLGPFAAKSAAEHAGAHSAAADADAAAVSSPAALTAAVRRASLALHGGAVPPPGAAAASSHAHSGGGGGGGAAQHDDVTAATFDDETALGDADAEDDADGESPTSSAAGQLAIHAKGTVFKTNSHKAFSAPRPLQLHGDGAASVSAAAAAVAPGVSSRGAGGEGGGGPTSFRALNGQQPLPSVATHINGGGSDSRRGSRAPSPAQATPLGVSGGAVPLASRPSLSPPPPSPHSGRSLASAEGGGGGAVDIEGCERGRRGSTGDAGSSQSSSAPSRVPRPPASVAPAPAPFNAAFTASAAAASTSVAKTAAPARTVWLSGKNTLYKHNPHPPPGHRKADSAPVAATSSPSSAAASQTDSNGVVAKTKRPAVGTVDDDPALTANSDNVFVALWWRPSSVIIGVLIMGLCLSYVTFVTAAVTLLACVPTQTSVATYRSMLQDGTALRNLNIPVDPPPALTVFLFGDPNAAVQLNVRTMIAHSYVVCGEGLQGTLQPWGWGIMIAFCIGFPILTALLVGLALLSKRRQQQQQLAHQQLQPGMAAVTVAPSSATPAPAPAASHSSIFSFKALSMRTAKSHQPQKQRPKQRSKSPFTPSSSAAAAAAAAAAGGDGAGKEAALSLGAALDEEEGTSQQVQGNGAAKSSSSSSSNIENIPAGHLPAPATATSGAARGAANQLSATAAVAAAAYEDPSARGHVAASSNSKAAKKKHSSSGGSADKNEEEKDGEEEADGHSTGGSAAGAAAASHSSGTDWRFIQFFSVTLKHHRWYFVHVNMFLLLALAAVSLLRNSFSDGIASAALQLCFTLAVLGIAAFLFAKQQPYAAGFGWMRPAMLCLIALYIAIAILNFVSAASSIVDNIHASVEASGGALSSGAGLAGSLDPTVLSKSEEALSVLCFVMSIGLYVLLLGGFLRSLLYPAKSQAAAPAGGAPATSTASAEEQQQPTHQKALSA